MRSFLSIQYVHGDLCKHLGIDSSTDLNDRYIQIGTRIYMLLTPISTTSGLSSTGNMRKYQQIDVYIYQCDFVLQQ